MFVVTLTVVPVMCVVTLTVVPVMLVVTLTVVPRNVCCDFNCCAP